ncbi:hypothetical protein ACOSQ3_029396 [Xanthoceras sorbifolium]
MASEKLLDTMKIKEKKFFHAKMTTYSKWGCIGLLKSKLTERQQKKKRATCFGHFLNVNEICFTGQFCHHILLRECHVDNAENEMWFLIGGNRIRFSANEFCLVSGLRFGDTVVPTVQKDDMCRIWQKYFKGAKKLTEQNCKVCSNVWRKNMMLMMT